MDGLALDTSSESSKISAFDTGSYTFTSESSNDDIEDNFYAMYEPSVSEGDDDGGGLKSEKPSDEPVALGSEIAVTVEEEKDSFNADSGGSNVPRSGRISSMVKQKRKRSKKEPGSLESKLAGTKIADSDGSNSSKSGRITSMAEKKRIRSKQKRKKGSPVAKTEEMKSLADDNSDHFSDAFHS